ncbi:MarR family transcriptional regulator [Streptomyces sp. NBC_00568]|uniref:MarR family winged helix-turn-helix transcriptional regulator n=1 Tax=Streptomyces sp. NBC_00568 TaxID=2975779 RepID=UPI002B1D3CF2|nr:MarR family transcriptional regulator [Streptomyces sp. NBC_00568]
MLRDLGLHPGQELLIMRLLDEDGQSQSDLQEAVGLDHSTVSRSLRRMETAGLLVREPAAHDRRVQLVHLTSRGRALRQPLQAMWSHLEQLSVRALDDDAITSFISSALAIESALTERDRSHD